MEIRETKKKNHNWIKELIIILVGIMILTAVSLRADAAENAWNGTIVYNNAEYKYYYIDHATAVYSNDSHSITFDKNVYVLPLKHVYGGNVDLYAVFDEPFDYTVSNLVGSNVSVVKTGTSTVKNIGDKQLYICNYSMSYGQSNYPSANMYNFNGLLLEPIINSFYQYVAGDDFVGYVPEPDLSDIESVGLYSEYIPTPKITVDNVGYGFGFNNAADNYYFELQGRWYSVDDIELFKENLQWKYKYSTLIKSSLTSWVNATDKLLATDGYNFSDLGEDAFESFLTSYPVDNRTYYGGTNSVGNYFSGYNNAMDTLKMLLNTPESLFNGLEIYIRYFTIDDKGNVNYGKWCHWYDALADSAGSSGSEIDDKQNMHSESQSESGLTTEQKESLEETGNSKSDTDVITQYINNSPDEIASQKIWEVMQSMISAMGVFPSLVSTVFGWLPSWLINMIGVSLASIIILRFIGR